MALYGFGLFSPQILFVLLLVYFQLISTTSTDDNFKENLLITPLENGFVNSYFEFKTEWNAGLPFERLHYNLFPKSLGQVIRKHQVQELHLSLTQGLWRHDKWGYPPKGAPPGTQLWVWFTEETKDIDWAWGDLVNALSGLFCASLNFIDETSTVRHPLSFRPQGISSEAYGRNTSLLRHASLPREVVCTENLTPWKKLLPCDSKAGLASLFKADKLYNAHYHSLAVDIRPVCRSGMIPCRESAVQLSQSLNVVFGPLAQNRQGTRQDVSLRVLFGKVLSGPCPMASSSRVIVDLSKNYSSNLLTLSPPPSETIISSTGERSIVYAIYDVKEWSARKGTLNVALTWTKQLNYGNVKSPPLLAYRYLSGYGQEKGGVSCLLRNNLDQPFKVIYTETFPWYMRLYLHTLQIRIGDRIIEPDNVFYVPGRDRSNPYLLEVVLTLPATSDMTLKIDFDKAFLRWTEYPPDANIGFFINSAIVSVMLPSTSNMSRSGIIGSTQSDGSIASKFFLCLYTKPLLIQLPTPDFSMPYNVICLACTVVAIGFGSLHNLTSRRFDFVDQSSSVGSLGMKLLAKFRKFRESGKRS